MRIAICGTRGIPNNYGGFEQCAEIMATLLVEKGHQVIVYNPHYHPFKESVFKGVDIVRIHNPETKIGTAGNFIYDYRCMKHALQQKSDIVLVLGYTTSSIFFPFLRRGSSVLVTNMDGLEWKRDKWNLLVKKLAKYFESLGARYSDYLVGDNREICAYLKEEYKKDSHFIPYGAEEFKEPDESILQEYGLKAGEYDLLIARMEKENNIETILDGVSLVTDKHSRDFLVIGNVANRYGQFLTGKYATNGKIRFIGGIYNLHHLNNLRYFSRFYFHGHSVGGTNPSLLEAMASSACIVAHDNRFNRDVLASGADYFKSADDIFNFIVAGSLNAEERRRRIQYNLELIRNQYNWKSIADRYESLFKTVLLHK